MLVKHGLLALVKPSEASDPEGIAISMKAQMSREQARPIHAIPSLLGEHRDHLRNAYLAAAPRDKKTKDADVPKLKEQAHEEAQKQFGDEDKKKAHAQPRGR